MQSNTNGRISFLGSVALLVSSMTGPGLVTIPLLFQTAGWLIPMICVAIVIMLSATASLFLCEALSAIPGNNNFQKKIEFSSLSTLLISNKYKCLMTQCILFISIQSINIACIILSAQTMDSLMISLLGKTCGIGIYPDSGVFCVYKQLPDGSPFGDKTMLVTFVMPLGLMDLVDNVRIQIVLIFIVMSWIITFCFHGLNKEFVPIIGDDISQVVGTILLNYSFIITIPSWINDLNPNVSIRKSIFYSIIISTVIYLLLGIFGGMSYKMDLSSNIISIINDSNERSIISLITTYLFPLAILITSIPVYTIIIKYNLIRNSYCGKNLANILSSALPWIIIIPFQTGYWLNVFMNWTTLIFTSICNFIIPFYLYYRSQQNNSFMRIQDYDDVVDVNVDNDVDDKHYLNGKKNLSNQKKDEKDDYDDDGDDDNEIENGYYNKEYNMKDISIISENQKNWNSPFKISSLPPSSDSIVTDSAPTVLLIHKSKSSSSFDSCRLINSNNDNSLLRTSYDRYDYRRKEDNKDPRENEGNNSEGIGGSGDDIIASPIKNDSTNDLEILNNNHDVDSTNNNISSSNSLGKNVFDLNNDT
nr:2773_t:CDS:10 [Entrophospora candida]CAG8471781.1 10428_t:CDS:10 [Entrophospora candida]